MGNRVQRDRRAVDAALSFLTIQQWLTCAIVSIAACTCIGCRGNASIYIVGTNTKRITSNQSMLRHVKPTECYYWVNDEGLLCIAMRKLSRQLWGKWFRQEFLLSIVLGKPPAGSAATYHGRKPAIRAISHRGLAHERYASLRGITGIWDYKNGKLKGRVRFHVKAQSYLVLTDWAYDRLEILTGEFEAVENRKAGEQIFAKSEAQGLARQTRRSNKNGRSGSARQ